MEITVNVGWLIFAILGALLAAELYVLAHAAAGTPWAGDLLRKLGL